MAAATTIQNKKGGMLTYDLYRLFQQYIRSGCNAMPDTSLLHDLVDGPVTTSEKRKRLRKKFKSWAARMDARPSDGRLVYKSTGKLIVPEEYFISTIKRKHCGPGDKHLNLTQTIEAVVAEYSVGKREFGIDRDLIVAVVNNCGDLQCQRARQQRQTKGPQGNAATSNPHGIQFTYVYHVKDQNVSETAPNSYGQPKVWQPPAMGDATSQGEKATSELAGSHFYRVEKDDRPHSSALNTDGTSNSNFSHPNMINGIGPVYTGQPPKTVTFNFMPTSEKACSEISSTQPITIPNYLAPSTKTSKAQLDTPAPSWSHYHVQSACMPTHHSCRRMTPDSGGLGSSLEVGSHTVNSYRSNQAKQHNASLSNDFIDGHLDKQFVSPPLPIHQPYNSNERTSSVSMNNKDALLMNRRYPPIQPKPMVTSDNKSLVTYSSKHRFQVPASNKLACPATSSSTASACSVLKLASASRYQAVPSSSSGSYVCSSVQCPVQPQSCHDTSCSTGLTMTTNDGICNKARVISVCSIASEDTLKDNSRNNESNVVKNGSATTKSQNKAPYMAIFYPPQSMSRIAELGQTRISSGYNECNVKVGKPNSKVWLSSNPKRSCGVNMVSRDMKFKRKSQVKRLLPVTLKIRAAKINELYTLLLKKIHILRRSLRPALITGSARMQETLRCYINDSLGTVHKLRMEAPPFYDDDCGETSGEEDEQMEEEFEAKTNKTETNKDEMLEVT